MNVAAAVISFLVGGFAIFDGVYFYNNIMEFSDGAKVLLESFLPTGYLFHMDSLPLGLASALLPAIMTFIAAVMLWTRNKQAVTMLVVSTVLAVLGYKFPTADLVIIANIIAIILAVLNNKKQQKLMQAAATPQAQENKDNKENKSD
ncbi:MAG: hypothetical protein IJ520_12740 [Synergistaceae bacterium]|nr:hypothetical protein [Synergistaceae bacterium]